MSGGSLQLRDYPGDIVRLSCEKCGRDGCYGLARLIDKRGRDATVIDWLDELTILLTVAWLIYFS
jgi:hypothetical protein